MSLHKINFQPNQLLKAEDLNDMQQNVQTALIEDAAKTFEVEIELLEEYEDNEQIFFIGAPNKTMAEIAEAAKSGKNVQASLRILDDGTIFAKIVGHLAICVEEYLAIFSLDPSVFALFGSDTYKNMAIVIALEEDLGSQELAMGMIFPNGELEFSYSNGNVVYYDPSVNTSDSIFIPSIDSTLNKSNYAADAKAVGTKINTINNTLTNLVKIPAPTAEDEGKVLKVVNGVPTWVEA